jgi:cytochrome P450
VSASSSSIALPPFVRRTLGVRSRRRIPFDAAVKLRAGEATWMLTHPDDVKHVLISNAENYSKSRFLHSARGRLRAGQGLLTSSGEEHHRQRRLLQPLFHQRVVERFCPVIVDRTERLLSRLEGAAEVDIATEMADLARSVILGVLFGIEYRDEGGRLSAAIQCRRRYTEYVYHSRLPFRTRLPTRVVREHRGAIRWIDEVISREIASRRRGVEVQGDDLLSLLLESTYSDGSRMSDRQVRDEVLTFTSTGYETLGDALAWTWYLLSQHPEVERRFVSELRAAPVDRVATPAGAAGLSFTEGVFREAMRIYPPTWIYERVARERDELPSGAVVPGGARLYVCQYVMHRHPRYFPEPEAFRPERFAGAGRRPYRFAYLPFGDGAHTCLGETLAMLEGVLVLGMVGRRFGFELLPGQQIVPRAGITLTPRHGIRVRPVSR